MLFIRVGSPWHGRQDMSIEHGVRRECPPWSIAIGQSQTRIRLRHIEHKSSPTQRAIHTVDPVSAVEWLLIGGSVRIDLESGKQIPYQCMCLLVLKLMEDRTLERLGIRYVQEIEWRALSRYCFGEFLLVWIYSRTVRVQAPGVAGRFGRDRAKYTGLYVDWFNKCAFSPLRVFVGI
jgi:hypothetical protein